MVRWGFAAIGATLAALSAAGGASAGCTVGKIADLPVTMSGTRPIVTAKINGQDVAFLADSGAFFSSITPANAKELHLSLYPAPSYVRLHGVTGDVEISLTRVNELTLAGQSISHVEFIVGGGEAGGGTIGLLGENVLGLADAGYDLANGMIRLLKTDGCGGTTMAYWDKTQTFSEAKLDWPDFGAQLTPSPRTEAFVNGHRIRVMMDTGASASILSLRAAADAGVTPQTSGAVAAGYTGGVGRRLVKTWVVPVASFKIGDEEIRNTKLRIGDVQIGGGADMLLGADFFLSHHIFIGNKEHKVFFTYNGGPVFNLAAVPLPSAEATSGPPASDPASTAAKASTAPATGAAASAGPAATENEPKDSEGYSRRGEAFLARRDIEHALADLTRATELAPTEARYFRERASARIANKQLFLAMADLDQALKLKPDDVDALVLRATLRLAGRDNAEGIADLDAADKLAPKEADIRLTMAMAYNRAAHFASAIPEFDLWIAAHRDDSRQPQALNGRCWARAQLGQDLERALRDCNDAMSGMGLSARANRALVRLRLGQYDAAIADYDIVLAQQPKYAIGLYGRGLAKLKKGLAKEGEADIAAAVALQPALPDILKARGIAP